MSSPFSNEQESLQNKSYNSRHFKFSKKTMPKIKHKTPRVESSNDEYSDITKFQIEPSNYNVKKKKNVFLGKKVKSSVANDEKFISLHGTRFNKNFKNNFTSVTDADYDEDEQVCLEQQFVTSLEECYQSDEEYSSYISLNDERIHDDAFSDNSFDDQNLVTNLLQIDGISNDGKALRTRQIFSDSVKNNSEIKSTDKNIGDQISLFNRKLNIETENLSGTDTDSYIKDTIKINDKNSNINKTESLVSDAQINFSMEKDFEITKNLKARDDFLYEHIFFEDEEFLEDEHNNTNDGKFLPNQSSVKNNITVHNDKNVINDERSLEIEELSNSSNTSLPENTFIDTDKINCLSVDQTNVSNDEELQIKKNLCITVDPVINNQTKLNSDKNLLKSNDFENPQTNGTSVRNNTKSPLGNKKINIHGYFTQSEMVDRRISDKQPMIINKLQSMEWLKTRSQYDANNMNQNSKSTSKSLHREKERKKDVPITLENLHNKKCTSINVAQNKNQNEIKAFDPSKQNNAQRSKAISLTNAWTSNNTTKELFPNVQNIDRIKEAEELSMCLAESICTAQQESERRKMVQASVKVNASDDADDNYWGNVHQNLPNNQSMDHPGMEQNYGKGFVDKYGRVDGYTEKCLFVGKGARKKEQEFLRAHVENKIRLQQQVFLESQTFAKPLQSYAGINKEDKETYRCLFETQKDTVIPNISQEKYGRSGKEYNLPEGDLSINKYHQKPGLNYGTPKDLNQSRKEDILNQSQEFYPINQGNIGRNQNQYFYDRSQEYCKNQEHYTKYQNYYDRNQKGTIRNQEYFNRDQNYTDKYQDNMYRNQEYYGRQQNYSDRNYETGSKRQDYLSRNQEHFNMNRDRNEEVVIKNQEYYNKSQNYYDRNHGISMKNPEIYNRRPNYPVRNQEYMYSMYPNYNNSNQQIYYNHGRPRNQKQEIKCSKNYNQNTNLNYQEDKRIMIENTVDTSKQVNVKKEMQSVDSNLANWYSDNIPADKFLNNAKHSFKNEYPSSNIDTKETNESMQNKSTPGTSTNVNSAQEISSSEPKPNVVMTFEGNQNVQRALGINPIRGANQETSNANVPNSDATDAAYVDQNLPLSPSIPGENYYPSVAQANKAYVDAANTNGNQVLKKYSPVADEETIVSQNSDVNNEQLRMNEISNSSQNLLNLQNTVSTLSKMLAFAEAMLLATEVKFCRDFHSYSENPKNQPVTQNQDQSPIDLQSTNYSNHANIQALLYNARKIVSEELPNNVSITNGQNFAPRQFNENPSIQQRLNLQSIYIQQNNLYEQRPANLNQQSVNSQSGNAIPKGKELQDSDERELRGSGNKF